MAAKTGGSSIEGRGASLSRGNRLGACARSRPVEGEEMTAAAVRGDAERAAQGARPAAVEITPEMIEAGARALSALDLIHFGGAREAAKLVFKEMLAASPYNLVAKSTTS
jgi:hypothetical protein